MSEAGPVLHLTGASHRSVPLEVREHIVLDDARRDELYARLRTSPGIVESLVLSTCNRVEVYSVVQTPDARDAVREHYCAVTGLAPDLLEGHGMDSAGRDAARHLMEVCSGLDSQIVGETEILGQVKQAYADATRRGAAGPVIHRLFQKAFQAAKWVRSNSGIGLGVLSLGNIAVELARRIYGDLGESRVLVVGSGKVGAGVARALRNRGALDICVTSRSAPRSAALAADINARALPFDAWEARVNESDIIVCCTAAPGVVLTRQAVAQAMTRRPARPLFIIDLAIPRDVDPAAQRVPNVFLYTLDDLAALANENLKARQGEIQTCLEVLHERADRLWEELTGQREATPRAHSQRS